MAPIALHGQIILLGESLLSREPLERCKTYGTETEHVQHRTNYMRKLFGCVAGPIDITQTTQGMLVNFDIVKSRVIRKGTTYLNAVLNYKAVFH